MARYYGAVYSFDPRTGKETVDENFGRGWEQTEAKSCTTPAASESAFYFRRNSHFLYDLETQSIKDMTRVSRPACWMSMIPAGGLITMLEQSTGCKCGFAIRLSVASLRKPMMRTCSVQPQSRKERDENATTQTRREQKLNRTSV